MIPVITLDGPSGSGKGTLSQLLADKLGWHYLDSGAIYRMAAWAVLAKKISLADETKLKAVLENLNLAIELDKNHVPHYYCEGQEITQAIREETCSMTASKIAAMPMVRSLLLQRQRDFRKAPGLVTDGRDMGTIVFPDASFKFFIMASMEERAKRRYLQLKSQRINGSLARIQEDLEERDRRDRERSISPLKPASGAVVVDTTHLTVPEVLDVLGVILKRVANVN
ncbi:MAG: cytidylate kinase [Gammaproteobacteria bacterium RIFOXYB2_FULL_38_6]|nr:MAG: cytidylate kinase [Gammaproteobacteria bacterium RIFOXYB2_FULL_38_6]